MTKLHAKRRLVQLHEPECPLKHTPLLSSNNYAYKYGYEILCAPIGCLQPAKEGTSSSSTDGPARPVHSVVISLHISQATEAAFIISAWCYLSGTRSARPNHQRNSDSLRSYCTSTAQNGMRPASPVSVLSTLLKLCTRSKYRCKTPPTMACSSEVTSSETLNSNEVWSTDKHPSKEKSKMSLSNCWGLQRSKCCSFRDRTARSDRCPVATVEHTRWHKTLSQQQQQQQQQLL